MPSYLVQDISSNFDNQLPEVLIDFSLTVKVATLGLAVLSAKEGKSGFIL